MNFLDFLLIMIRYCTILVSIINLVISLKGYDMSPENVHLYQACAFIQAAGSAIIISAADYILAIRIWALYHRNNRLLFFLIFFIIVQTVISILMPSLSVASFNIYNVGIHISSSPSGQLQIIATSSHQGITIIQYLPNATTAVLMFILSIGRCIRLLKGTNLKYTPIISMFLRDGVLWLFCALAVIIIQMAFLSTEGQTLFVPGVLVVVAMSIVSSRVLINMRSLEVEAAEAQQSRPLTTLVFQSVAHTEDSTTIM